MSFFKYYPTTQYDGYEVLDITRKAKLSALIADDVMDYMNYTVAEGERPEDVAFYYYDDASLAWLVLMSNNIMDPYSEWPMSQENLEKHIVDKYKARSGRQLSNEILNWTKNETIASNIIDYKSQYDEEIRINRASFVAYGDSHRHTVSKVKSGETYTVNSTGDISGADWNNLSGSSGVGTGTVFTATRDGAGILFADTATVTGESSKSPAREFVAVRAYDYEFELNEQRREIQLINKGYVAKIKDQLETILTDG